MNDNKTPVTRLQEMLQKLNAAPTYNLIEDGTGSHEPSFSYEVIGLGESGIGVGKSKKEAKHQAAHALLQKLSGDKKIVNNDEPMETMSPYAENIKDNAVGMLFDYCMDRGFPAPIYNLTRNEGLPHAKVFCFSCSVSSYRTDGESRTKKQAKQCAAMLMLDKLQKCMEDLKIPLPTPHKKDISVETDVKKKILDLKIPMASCANGYGMKIKDYPFIFKSEHFPKSQTLDDIKLEEVVDDTDTLMQILDEMQFDTSVKSFESLDPEVSLVSFSINSTPPWIFLGTADTEELALKNAHKKALTFMVHMAK